MIGGFKEHATGVVQNPHDPDAQWSAKGKQKKTWVGYKAQVAESLPEKEAPNQKRFIVLQKFRRFAELLDGQLRRVRSVSLLDLI
jgi:hypothetical protein